MKYDFIEIGTSDFDTLLQCASNDMVGLSIEPLQLYLDKLPNKDNVKKVCAAISDKEKNMDLYYIEPEVIEKYNFDPGMRGCNSLGAPHQSVIATLGEELYHKVVTKLSVECITWDTLIERYDVTGIDILKIDTEGHEEVVLAEYLKVCVRNPELFADRLIFEYNVLSNLNNLDALISKFEEYNYALRYKGVKENAELVRNE